MERRARAASILGDFGVKPYYLLQCIALRLGVSCKRRSVISLPADDIARGWESAVDSMAAVLTLLRDECGVLTPKWLPYEPMLIPLATVWNEVAADDRSGARRDAVEAQAVVLVRIVHR